MQSKVPIPSDETEKTSDEISASIIFTYDGKEYNLQEREGSINALMSETPVGNVLVVDGHISPYAAYYGIFDMETESFIKDILGTNLAWRDEDITTAVYNSGAEIYDYEGNLLKALELGEREYIYRLAWTDSWHLFVEILSDSSETSVILDLEVPVN